METLRPYCIELFGFVLIFHVELDFLYCRTIDLILFLYYLFSVLILSRLHVSLTCLTDNHHLLVFCESCVRVRGLLFVADDLSESLIRTPVHTLPDLLWTFGVTRSVLHHFVGVLLYVLGLRDDHDSFLWLSQETPTHVAS